jgi:RNA polymerase sigma-70 factor (ECF subfamily)
VDQQLISAVERATRGDRAAQATLLRELQDPWFRMCLSLLKGDAERARDATQETALRFLKLLPTFRGQSHIRTWSLGIAINVVRELRRGDSATDRIDRERVEAQQRESESPLSAAGKSEEQERLRQVLERLPERQREAIVLRFFEDLSVEEAANAMNCATGTVKATVHQALKALKQAMTKSSEQTT